jgi:hypothetical protein
VARYLAPSRDGGRTQALEIATFLGWTQPRSDYGSKNFFKIFLHTPLVRC